jgi:hypothetical protein
VVSLGTVLHTGKIKFSAILPPEGILTWKCTSDTDRNFCFGILRVSSTSRSTQTVRRKSGDEFVDTGVTKTVRSERSLAAFPGSHLPRSLHRAVVAEAVTKHYVLNVHEQHVPATDFRKFEGT